jgi:hypothetical protein
MRIHRNSQLQQLLLQYAAGLHVQTAIDRLAYLARELASFASYTLALFGQNAVVARS